LNHEEETQKRDGKPESHKKRQTETTERMKDLFNIFVFD
jgi:hypothetical protein